MKLFVFLLIFLIQFHPSNEKENQNDQEILIEIIKLLKNKEGKSPEYFREYSSRLIDDSQKLVFPSLKEPEIKVPNTVIIHQPITKPQPQPQLPSLPQIEQQSTNSNSNSNSNSNPIDSIASFQKKMQNLKQNPKSKQILRTGVGQVMRGDAAKKLYQAEVNLRYDTVEGFSKNRQKSNSNNTNQNNTTVPKPKKQEITILTSSPKKHHKTIPLPESSTFRKHMSKEEKSRKYVGHRDPDETGPLWSNTDGEDEVMIEWCRFAKKNYSVIPDESWGELPLSLQKIWSDYQCNNYFLSKRIHKRPVVTCPEENYKRSIEVNSSFPLIAILAATTSRTIYRPAIQNLSLFQLLLKSLIRSLDCGFRYLVVVGYDRGDIFYDTIPGVEITKLWFENNILLPLKSKSVDIKLHTVAVNNPIQKPGPVFNSIAKEAYELGADYFYRVNDDTEFLHRWPILYTKTLMSLTPPYGVIGPYTVGKNNRILTIDFVHRTHMEIFHLNYYPIELPDWWMDDWITHVYGTNRSFLSRHVVVMHHTQAHGKRYDVNFDNENKLISTIQNGRKLIRKWMQKHNTPKKELTDFMKLPLPNALHGKNLVAVNFRDILYFDQNISITA